jgi:hypothetical protein
VRRLLLLALTVPASAGAAEPVCRVLGPQDRVERELRSEIRLRNTFAFGPTARTSPA